MRSESTKPRDYGSYRLLEELGRGGQGTVWLAEDTKLKRKVALKVLSPAAGALSDDQVARFRREAEAASKLDHPNICGLLDAGEVDDTPYLAYRFVEGHTLAERIAQSYAQREGVAIDAGVPDAPDPTSRAGIERIVAQFEKLARALHIAHEKGLVHRDVKPGNVMITPDGEPVLLDFGLARDELGEDLSLTHSGDLLGTPAYMSPEQLTAHRVPLDRRTDVYSLGATLYEALTLHKPFTGRTRAELYQRILAADPGSVSALNRQIPHDLRVVVETAIDKDRNRRYQTALDLAEDLRRFRQFEPVKARPIGKLLKLKRWAQRHPARATAGLATILGFVTLAVFAWTVDRERRISQALAASYDAATTSPQVCLREALEAVNLAPDRPETLTQLQAAMALQHVAARARLHRDVITSIDHAARPGLLVSTSLDKTARLWDLAGEPSHPIPHPFAVRKAVFSPDQTRFLTLCKDGVRLWNLHGDPIHPKLLREGTTDAAWHPDGERVLTTHRDGSVRVWDLASGRSKELPTHHRSGVDGGLWVSRDEVATWDTAGNVRIQDVTRPAPSAEVRMESSVSVCAASPAGTHLVVFDAVGRGQLWDRHSWTQLAGHTEFVRTARFSADGARFLTSSYDATARLWNTADGTPLQVVAHHSSDVTDAAFLEDVPLVCTVSGDTTVAVWSTTGRPLLTLRGHEDAVEHLLVVDAHRVVTASQDGEVRVWNLHGWSNTRLTGHHMLVTDVAFDARGRIATTSKDGQVQLWDAGRADIVDGVQLGSAVTSVAFSPDSTVLLAGTQEGTLYSWRPGVAEAPLRVDAHRSGIWHISCARDGRILTSSYDGTARIWSPDLTRSTLLCEDRGSLKFCSWSPDGRWIALPDDDGVLLCDPKGTRRLPMALHGARRVRAASFDPDSRWLLTAGADGTARLWDLDGLIASADGAEEPGDLHRHLRQTFAHLSTVTSAVFSPDGQLVLTASRDGTARLWTLDGELVFSMTEPRGIITKAVFSPDGAWAVTCSSQGHVRFWPIAVDDLVDAAQEALEHARRDP